MKKAICTLAFVCGVAFAITGFASAVIESATGDVRVGPSAAAATPAAVNRRILPGWVVVTGPKSLTTLRFDDGQAVLLSENSEFKVTEYSFTRETPAKDRFVFELAKGAMRAVTGLLAGRNPQAYELRVPQATIGIRGTDFMVGLVNPAFLSVLTGTVGVSNAAGVATFAAGSSATVASSTALATAIPASALPAPVSAAFKQLSSIVVSVGAAGAAEAAVGGVSPAALGVVGIIAIGVAAAGGDGTPGTTGTTGTTGTR